MGIGYMVFTRVQVDVTGAVIKTACIQYTVGLKVYITPSFYSDYSTFYSAFNHPDESCLFPDIVSVPDLARDAAPLSLI